LAAEALPTAAGWALNASRAAALPGQTGLQRRSVVAAGRKQRHHVGGVARLADALLRRADGVGDGLILGGTMVRLTVLGNGLVRATRRGRIIRGHGG
jgi:hypothetical protein